MAVKDVVRFRTELLEYLRAKHADVLAQIHADAKFTDTTEGALKEAIASFKKQFAAS